MQVIPTNAILKTTYSRVEDHVKIAEHPTDLPGLKFKYQVEDHPRLNDEDYPWYPHHAGAGVGGEFSIHDQEKLKEHFLKVLAKRDKIVIVEIGVHRNPYAHTSTSIFLDNKRPQDIYVGIDIDDKSFLNNPDLNIHTIRTRSEEISMVHQFLDSLGVDNIDVLMIDGWHSINQVYKEWEYTKRLSVDGIVIFHDTNAHPGPYFIIQSIDTNQYDVYKYFSDIQDWGLSVALRKGGA